MRSSRDVRDMPSASVLAGVRERIATQRNGTIVAAILVAVPTSYAFGATIGGDVGNFLLLVTLAVGVPTAYDEYWPRYDRTWKAVAWVLVACGVTAVEFSGLYVAGRAVFALSPTPAAVGAFLVVGLGNLAWLAARRR
jgi:hypothetical protein